MTTDLLPRLLRRAVARLDVVVVASLVTLVAGLAAWAAGETAWWLGVVVAAALTWPCFAGQVAAQVAMVLDEDAGLGAWARGLGRRWWARLLDAAPVAAALALTRVDVEVYRRTGALWVGVVLGVTVTVGVLFALRAAVVAVLAAVPEPPGTAWAVTARRAPAAIVALALTVLGGWAAWAAWPGLLLLLPAVVALALVSLVLNGSLPVRLLTADAAIPSSSERDPR